MPPIGTTCARWLKEHDDTLRELVLKGFSASRIAAEMPLRHGLSVTRNAIIGRCHRIGLRIGAGLRSPVRAKSRPKPAFSPQSPSIESMFDSPVRAGEPTEKPETHHAPRSLIFFAPLPDLDAAVAITPTRAFLPIEGSSPVRLLDLKLDMCRWPVSGRDEVASLFCGCPCKRGKSYCPSHSALASGAGTAAERNADKTVPA